MDEIRLYEYDYDKPELSEEVLEHHGILGMRWGHRNGPPYPLNSSVSTGHRLKDGSGPSKRKSRKAHRKQIKNLKKARKVRDQNRQAAEQTQKTKEEILKSKDIVSMFKNVDMFDNKEINDVLTRLDVEKKLQERVSDLNKRNRSKKDKIKDYMKDLAREAASGSSKGLKKVVKTVGDNATRELIKKALESMAEGDENMQDWVKKLLKEEKKK